MVARIRTLTGVTNAGFEALRKAVKYGREHYPNVHFDWLTSVSGELGTHIFVVKLPSMAEIEDYEAKLSADAGWIKIWNDAGTGLFWTGFRDEFYSTVQE